MSHRSSAAKFSFLVALVVAFGALLFGFSTSVISGALLFLTHEFHFSVLEQEFIVSSLLVSAMIGSLSGGFVSDRFGRKKALLLTSILFFIGSLFLSYATGFRSLLLGRLILGFGVGVVSVTVPLYIAEISLPSRRGALVSLNQLLITIGILLAFSVSLYYSKQGSWREMFFFGVFLSIVQGVGLLFIPETPAWLISRNRVSLAQKVEKLIGHVPETKADPSSSKGGWRELIKSHMRRPFFVGIGVSVFQQITGINAVIYYAPQIFQQAGYKAEHEAIFAAVIIGIMNVLMTLVAFWLIDRAGRRPLMLSGLIGMSCALIILGFSFFGSPTDTGWIALGSLLVYIAFFAVSLGPCAWLIISEIYPHSIRGRAMGIATFSNWLCNYFVSLTFLSLVERLGSAYTFWLYALIALLGWWFTYRMVPETKGKTFLEIQKFWRK